MERKGSFNSLGDAHCFNLPNQKKLESLLNSSHVASFYFFFYFYFFLFLSSSPEFPFLWDKVYEDISQGAIGSSLNCSGKIVAISASYLIELASPVFSSASVVDGVQLIITHL